MHTAVVTRSTEGYAAHTLLLSPISRGLCSMHTAAVTQTEVYAACTLLLSLINRGLCSTHNAVVSRTTEGYAAHTLLLSLEPQRIMQYAHCCCTRSTEGYTYRAANHRAASENWNISNNISPKTSDHSSWMMSRSSPTQTNERQHPPPLIPTTTNKSTCATVVVDIEGERVHHVFQALLQDGVRQGATEGVLKDVEVGGQGVLVHGVDGRQVAQHEKEDGPALGGWPVPVTEPFDVDGSLGPQSQFLRHLHTGGAAG